MVSRPPDLATLDELIARVRAEPPSARSIAVLQNLQLQRDELTGPEDTPGEVGTILRELESGSIAAAAAAARLVALSPNTRTPPAAVMLPLETACLGGRITEAQYAEVLTHMAVSPV